MDYPFILLYMEFSLIYSFLLIIERPPFLVLTICIGVSLIFGVDVQNSLDLIAHKVLIVSGDFTRTK